MDFQIAHLKLAEIIDCLINSGKRKRHSRNFNSAYWSGRIGCLPASENFKKNGTYLYCHAFKLRMALKSLL